MMDELDKTMPGYRDRQTDGRFAIGDLIMGRYKVLAELGQGGMGVVYKCFDETAGIEVALKALPPELSHNSLEMEDIKDNFQLVHNLHHPNIASSNTLEKNPENGNYYLIMECCEGEDLRRWIKRKRRDNPLTLNDVLPVIRQVADALDYAHGEKVMHRDIKPGNIMINSDGKVKVLDFGLAAQIHTSMTRVSMAYRGTSGTGPYMAPEQWRGKKQGASADQYALAVMTYEMLSGDLPFESPDPAVLQQAVLTQEADPIEGLPATSWKALQRAMSKEPADRFNSCADFAAALGGAKVAKSKKVSSGKSGGGAWKWIAAVIVLALLAGGVYFVVNEQDRKERVRNAEEKQQEKNEERAENERIARERAENEQIARERAENERIAREREQQILEKKGELQTLKRKIRSWHLHEGDAESENQWAILEQNENNANSSAYPESKITFLDRALAAANWLIKNNKPDTCFSRGRDCAQQKNYTQAVKWYRKAAEQGNANAQCSLGWCYQYGQGVEKDLAKAVELYRKAAEQGNAPAQHNLGWCYYHGQWVERDYYEAVKWFRKAAEQGDMSALNYLGVCYDNGQGVERDHYEAVKWFRKAAEQGEMYAQNNLGLSYQYGRGVDKDINEAVKWYRKAAEQGHEAAKKNLQDLGY